MPKEIIKDDFDDKKFEYYEFLTEALFESNIFLDLTRIIEVRREG